MSGSGDKCLVAVNQRGEVSVLYESHAMKISSQLESWSSLTTLPTDDEPSEDLEPMESDFLAGAPGSKAEDQCVPCSSCKYFDGRCWTACSIECEAAKSCVVIGNDVQKAAAQTNCDLVWVACGTPNQKHASTINANAQLISTAAGPDLSSGQLLARNRVLCEAKLKSLCHDAIWRINLYEVMSCPRPKQTLVLPIRMVD